jgi:DNA-binding transcriptional LysR family regulator
MEAILFIEIVYNWSMEIRQIQAFLAVVREGSFTQAAHRLNLTQPSLSARIQQLEFTLNGALFQRDKRPVQLTPLGEIFVDYAERALNILEAGKDAVRSASLGPAGRVTVCCPYSLATYLMPLVVNQFTNLYTQVELSLEVGHSDFAISQLLDGLVNLALAAAFPRFASQTQTILRFHDEMVVAVNAVHPLAALDVVTLDLLWPHQTLIIHWGTAFAAYIDSLRQMAATRGPAISVPLASALPMMVEPQAITFLPRRLTAVSGLVELNVPDFTFGWDTLLVARLGHKLTLLEQAFVDVVASVWANSEPTS